MRALIEEPPFSTVGIDAWRMVICRRMTASGS